MHIARTGQGVAGLHGRHRRLAVAALATARWPASPAPRPPPYRYQGGPAIAAHPRPRRAEPLSSAQCEASGRSPATPAASTAPRTTSTRCTRRHHGQGDARRHRRLVRLPTIQQISTSTASSSHAQRQGERGQVGQGPRLRPTNADNDRLGGKPPWTSRWPTRRAPTRRSCWWSGGRPRPRASPAAGDDERREYLIDHRRRDVITRLPAPRRTPSPASTQGDFSSIKEAALRLPGRQPKASDRPASSGDAAPPTTTRTARPSTTSPSTPAFFGPVGHVDRGHRSHLNDKGDLRHAGQRLQRTARAAAASPTSSPVRPSRTA